MLSGLTWQLPLWLGLLRSLKCCILLESKANRGANRGREPGSGNFATAAEFNHASLFKICFIEMWWVCNVLVSSVQKHDSVVGALIGCIREPQVPSPFLPKPSSLLETTKSVLSVCESLFHR